MTQEKPAPKRRLARKKAEAPAAAENTITMAMWLFDKPLGQDCQEKIAQEARREPGFCYHYGDCQHEKALILVFDESRRSLEEIERFMRSVYPFCGQSAIAFNDTGGPNDLFVGNNLKFTLKGSHREGYEVIREKDNA